MFVCVFTGSCESVGATDLTRDGDIWRLQPGGVQYYSSEYVVCCELYLLQVGKSYQLLGTIKLSMGDIAQANRSFSQVPQLFVRNVYSTKPAVILCIKPF